MTPEAEASVELAEIDYDMAGGAAGPPKALVAASRRETQRGAAGLKQATWGWLITADPFPDNACFYAREPVETNLKAILQKREIRSERTADLPELAKLAGILDGAMALTPRLKSELRWLSQFTGDISYPGWTGDPVDPTRALGVAADLSVHGPAPSLGLAPRTRANRSNNHRPLDPVPIPIPCCGVH